MEILKLGRPYSFGGRKPIVPVKYSIFSNGRRAEITGFYVGEYREYLKFMSINPINHKTQAEIEGLTEPPVPMLIRLNRNCTIREVEFNGW